MVMVSHAKFQENLPGQFHAGKVRVFGFSFFFKWCRVRFTFINKKVVWIEGETPTQQVEYLDSVSGGRNYMPSDGSVCAASP